VSESKKNTNAIQLNLAEANELRLSLSIEGSSEDLGGATPKIRFFLREAGSEAGRVYPVSNKTDKSGEISIRIPPSEEFKEKQLYSGLLEVFIDNHYFTPAEVEIEFIRPLRVEASISGGNKAPSSLQQEHRTGPSVRVSSVSVTKPTGKKTVETKEPTATSGEDSPPGSGVTWESLSGAQQAKVKEYLHRKAKREREARRATLKETLKKALR
jgi:hypothetical protein